MRDGQIERLLGGYATNTLTESERQALFEAALEDQELFDALQDEQALRELLDDSESRLMIERAAKESRPAPVRGWFARPWAWGVAGCVAAVGALAFVLGPFGQSSRMNREVAVLRAPPSIENAAPSATNVVPPPKAVERRAVTVPAGNAAKKERAPELVVPEIARPRATGQISSSAGSVRQVAPQMGLGGSDEDKLKRVLPSASFRASTVAAPRTDVISYSVVRRSPNGSFSALPQGEALQAGDSVRVVARPPVSGTLSIYQESAAGNWDIVQTLPVAAGGEYPVPRAPIVVNTETRLRLMVTPGEMAAPSELQEAAKRALGKPKQRLDTERATASQVGVSVVPQRPVITDITLAPGKP